MSEPSDITLFIDPFSHHFEGDTLFDATQDQLNGADILGPWAYLHQWFTSRGVRVHTADRLERGEVRAAVNVFVSFGLLRRYRQLAHRNDVILSAYFAFESPIVTPHQFAGLATAQRHFKRIFTFTDAEALAPFLRAPLQSQLFHLPSPLDGVREELWSRQPRKFLVMINQNKLPLLYWNELYTERMRAVAFFGGLGEIDLYGVGWDGPSFRICSPWVPGTAQRLRRALERQWHRVRPDPLLEAARRVYRGPLANKLDTLAQYTFSLCFENVVLKGWVTEKIFDCLATGTIPIYWGAADIADFVPPSCFIDMREFSRYEDLRAYLKSLSPKQIEAYRENGRAYLASPKFQPFTKQAFVDLLASVVEEDARVQLR